MVENQPPPRRRMLRAGTLGAMAFLALLLLLNFWEELFGARPAIVTWVLAVSACLTLLGVIACLVVGTPEERKGLALLLAFVGALVLIEEFTGLSVKWMLLILLVGVFLFVGGLLLWLRWDMWRMNRELEQLEMEDAAQNRVQVDASSQGQLAEPQTPADGGRESGS